MIRLPRGAEEGGLDVSRFEKRIVREDFLVRCARREEFQNIQDTEACPADARMPAAFARFDCDAFEEWHVRRLAGFQSRISRLSLNIPFLKKLFDHFFGKRRKCFSPIIHRSKDS